MLSAPIRAYRPRGTTSLKYWSPIRAANNLPSLSAAVLENGEIIAIGATGLRSVASTEPVTPYDRHHLGSCTKAMTATLTALHVVDGVIAWDTTLADVFPDLVGTMDPAYETVTLDQLLAHYGGLPTAIPLSIGTQLAIDTSPIIELRRWFVEQMLALPPSTVPGTTFEYANAGYMIVGSVLEEVTGVAWEDLMQARIFDPLGMSSCGFGPPATPGTVDAPWGHVIGPTPVDPGHPSADNPPAVGPAGTVHCSLIDWAKFVDVHIQGANGDETFLPAAQFTVLHTPWAAGSDYALGWGTGTRPWAGGAILSHAGSNTMNFAVVWAALPTDRAFFSVTNIGDAGGPTDDAVAALIGLYVP